METKIREFLNSDFAKSIQNSTEFFFLKGQEALQKWLSYNLSEHQLDVLINESKDYKNLLSISEKDDSIREVLHLIFEIISYCDQKARDKDRYNQYPDNRTMAMAYVRMNHWVEKLFWYKVDTSKVPAGSVLNAINYLLEPSNQVTILSNDHRQRISDELFNKAFDNYTFAQDLRDYYSNMNISCANEDNYTFLLSCIIYTIKDEWLTQDKALVIDLGGNSVFKISMGKDYFSRDTIQAAIDEEVVIVHSKSKPKGRAIESQGDYFSKHMKEGDYFYLTYSNIDIYLIGRVISESRGASFKNMYSDGWLERDYEIIVKSIKSGSYTGNSKYWLPNATTTCWEIPSYEIDDANKMLFEPFFNVKFTKIGTDNLEPSNNSSTIKEISKYPLNQILYGPPGTGKTYATRQMAVAIANPAFNYSDDIELKEEYNRLVKEGQIKFTTFHQSMGYEDFVEGIKPVLLEEANEESTTANATISYKVEAGIFKELAEIAKGVSGSKNTSQAINVEEVRYFKMSLGGKQRPKTHNWCIENNVIGLGWGGKHNFTSLAHYTNWDEFKVEFAEQFPELKEESSYIPQAIRILQKMSIGDIVIVSKGNHIIDAVGVVEGDYEYDENNPHGIYHQRKVKWIATNMDASPSLFVDKNISQQSIYEFYSVDIKTDEIAKLIAPETATNATKNYVLIIDEINRGNVSAIFGELITLLEDTKRLGSKEELKVTLPYSKTEFGVPANVYIIGTMNTADRSVEALDTALRRRFSFTEMMPDATLLGAIQFGAFSLAEILETINQRVAILLDRDHTIGHSYFMQLQNDDYNGLKEVFVNKIIPLLQEYFYNDYEKIAMVLGEGFVEVATTKVTFAYKPSGDYGSDSNITLKKSADILIESAIQKLMNVKPSE